MKLETINKVLNSQQHKSFIKEVINEYFILSNEIKRGRNRGLYKTTNIPILILSKPSLKVKTGVIRCLKSRVYKKANWLDSHITIDGDDNIYEVPLCKDNEVLNNAGLHNKSPLFCMTSVDYNLYEESSDIEDRLPNLDFYFIRQLVEEVHSEDYNSIEHIAETMKDYVRRYK